MNILPKIGNLRQVKPGEATLQTIEEFTWPKAVWKAMKLERHSILY